MTKSAEKVRVLATGTFDVLHPGHLLYLEEAKKLGGESAELWVIVARDIAAKNRPAKNTILSESERLEMVRALKIVDHAILGSTSDIFDSVKTVKPDIIALGPTQAFSEEWVAEQLAARGLKAKVVRVKRATDGLSSTQLTGRIFARFLEEREKEDAAEASCACGGKCAC